MSELTFLVLRIGFLLLLWGFVFVVVYSLRADLFGVKVRKLPEPQAVGAPAHAAAATPTKQPKAAKPKGKGSQATRESATRIVVTSGPKAGIELPLGAEPLTIGRSSESGLVIRDDFTSSHHARLLLWGDQWMIQDLGSTNGTWHNGDRVSNPVPVALNAPIKVGATTFELRA